jgi:hypothetical protein
MLLTSLPNELLIHLSEFLDWPSLKHIRSSSKQLAELIPKDVLPKYHARQSRFLHDEEDSLYKDITQAYWEEAEESFLGYHSSSYTSSSLDPDLRAHEESLKCIYHKLPCYHCLTWKPSPTDSPAFENSSAFSRQMSTGWRNLGSRDAKSRICIDCGIRTRFYNKGTMVKHSAVCYACGALTAPIKPGMKTRSRFYDEPWQAGWLCSSCCTDSKYASLTRKQFQHEQRWEKYEASMQAGKLYRLTKGKELRLGMTEAHQNLGDLSLREQSGPEQSYKKPRYCKVMKEMRFCHCTVGHGSRTKKVTPGLTSTWHLGFGF